MGRHDPHDETAGPPSKPMPRDCNEEENRRGEGSKPNYDSPDKRSLFLFAVIAMKMPVHLNLCTYPQCRERHGPTKPTPDGALS